MHHTIHVSIMLYTCMHHIYTWQRTSTRGFMHTPNEHTNTHKKSCTHIDLHSCVQSMWKNGRVDGLAAAVKALGKLGVVGDESVESTLLDILKNSKEKHTRQVCMFVAFVCVYIYIYACIYMCVCVYEYVYMYMNCMFVYDLYVRMTCMYVCMYVYDLCTFSLY